VIAGVIQVILWIIYFQRVNNNLSEWQFDLAYAKNLLKNAWPLIITGISVAVYMKIDQVMLKNMVDANAVGNYSVAVTVSELWYFIPVTIASSVFPSIIKSKNFGTERYHRRMQYLYDVLTIVALVIALPMTFLSEFVISFLFGSEFSEASGVLAIYIWAGVFVFLGVVRSSWLINENYQSYGMFFTVLGAVSNVMINIWLIPIYGITGAAVATLISYMISAWLTGVIFQKTRIAFKMQCMAILRTVLIIPACHSFIQIYKEAKNSKS
jgi:O-antigen/teichoic acid export membrane protein